MLQVLLRLPKNLTVHPPGSFRTSNIDNAEAAGESNAPPPLRRVICPGCRRNGELETRIELLRGERLDFPEGESLSLEDIVRDWDDPNDFSWWQPAFDVLAPPDAEKEAS